MTNAEIWTIIITGLGVIATFSAVFVALYQTRIAYRKRLRVKFGINTFLIGTFDKDIHANMEIVNLGNRKINIVSCYIWTLDDKKLAISPQKNIFFLVNGADDPGIKLPITLNPEDNLAVLIPLSEIYKAITKNQTEYRETWKIEVKDNTGKSYTCKYKLKWETLNSYFGGES